VGLAGAAYIAAPPLLSGLLSSPTAQAATAAAKLTPELTEGPYWVNTMLRRADIRANTKTAATSPGAQQTGVPLRLTINVRDTSNHRKPLNRFGCGSFHFVKLHATPPGFFPLDRSNFSVARLKRRSRCQVSGRTSAARVPAPEEEGQYLMAVARPPLSQDLRERRAIWVSLLVQTRRSTPPRRPGDFLRSEAGVPRH
jgi:hypothetical protein